MHDRATAHAANGQGVLAGLNAAQAAAAAHGDGPLLIIAGAGTGKTRTLVHRVAHLIERGADPRRILLLTFTRRAAAEMLRRVDGLLGELRRSAASPAALARCEVQAMWGGTFHSVATRMLRIYGQLVGLEANFTIHDRSDSEDLLDVVRTELGLAKSDRRFPKKGTCLAIYSHCVNSQRPLEDLLGEVYPWCQDFAADLKRLFQTYVDRKEQESVLDYDDLLVFWHALLSDAAAGDKVRNRFDCVLVDEYQDTNRLQAEILRRLRPSGAGLTAVGDDAQSIYSFRAATVRNILDFPAVYPQTTIVSLEQNYRSVQPILDATNSVIAESSERFVKNLWSERKCGNRPGLVTCHDEDEQADFVARAVLEHREAGIELKRQAVLFRASHHSIVLEAELARRNIPFVKYGGLKFVETAHVKDLMAFLRLAENPKDAAAGMRILMLLPGVGPKKAQQLMQALRAVQGDFGAWREARVPAAAAELWPKLIELMQQMRAVSERETAVQVQLARKFYAPLLEQRYDRTTPRLRDLEQLEQLAGRFATRAAMLAEIALDPPATTEDLAGEPLLDEDYLVLSTIHSAKGLEWDAVYVIHASDGNIPSDMATGSAEQIEEERRLFYVALTRAKDWLYVCFPQKYFHAYRGRSSDQFGYAQLSRFLPPGVKQHFACSTAAVIAAEESSGATPAAETRQNVRQQVRALWA